MAQQSSAADFTQKDEEYSGDEAAFFNRGCCCFFNIPCFKSGQSDDWERISTSGREQEVGVDRSWWGKGIDALKKVREWSELVAGPKWKTFIRRFNRTAGKARPGKFQYDPLSYSLNFDDGREQSAQYESDLVFRDFSSRYAAIPSHNGAA